MNFRFLIPLFLIITIMDLYLVYSGLPYRHFTKPLLMIILIIYFLLSIGNQWKSHSTFIMAMFFAWLGDVFLLGDGTTYFMLGLGSFLIMQLLYSVVFYRQKGIGVHKHKFKILLICIFGMITSYLIISNAGDLVIPVILYILSILAMSITGVLRWDVEGYQMVVIGVILFLISDATLGYNKFVNPLPLGGIIIMSTYAIAQLLIVMGYTKGAVKLKTSM